MLDFPEKKHGILILTEDSKSSAFYFKSKCKYWDLKTTAECLDDEDCTLAVDVIGLGRAPISLVNYAMKKCKMSFSEASNRKAVPYAEIYCVIDVDEHETLQKSIELAKRFNRKNSYNARIIPIISNVCFELWYLLHFADFTTKELYRENTSNNPAFKKYIPKNRNLFALLDNYLTIPYEKSIQNILNVLIISGASEEKAIKTAKRLEQHHLRLNYDKQLHLCNPYTNVYKLVERLNQISKNAK